MKLITWTKAKLIKAAMSRQQWEKTVEEMGNGSNVHVRNVHGQSTAGVSESGAAARRKKTCARGVQMLPALRQRNLASVTGAFCRAQEPIRLAFIFQAGS
jgi:hypothetical protein